MAGKKIRKVKSKRKGVCLCICVMLLLCACGKSAETAQAEDKTEAPEMTEEASAEAAESGVAIIGGGVTGKEAAGETHKPQKTGKKEEEKKEVSGEVIGGTGNGKVIAGLKGALELSEDADDKLQALSDSIDLEEVENMSEEEKAELVDSLDELAARHDAILEDIMEAFADEDIELNIDETTGKIVMADSILFATDESEVTQEGKEFLDEFAGDYIGIMLEMARADYIKEIRIEGNADQSGEYEYNKKLSEKRAEAVKTYCLESEKNGLSEQDREQFSEIGIAVGNSYDNPVYKEDGTVDMDASRRVEFKFILNLDV